LVKGTPIMFLTKSKTIRNHGSSVETSADRNNSVATNKVAREGLC